MFKEVRGEEGLMASIIDENEVERRKRELEKISEIARWALIFATDKRYYIPLTPENYEKCYSIVERLKERGVSLTWENFIKEWGLGSESLGKETVLAETSAKLYAMAEELANQADQLYGVGRDFDSTIEIFADGVKEAKDRKDVASLIKGLLGEIAQAQKKVEELTKELEDSKRQIKELKQELRKVQIEALTDRLTGALNRGSLETMVMVNIKKRRAEGTPFSVVIFDIDNFKKINDEHGHVFGDDVLKKVTEVVKSSLANGDLLYRYGGDEFCILLPGRKLSDAVDIMERVFSNIEKIAVMDSKGRVLRVSISAGIAEANKKDTPKDLLLRADEALYLAKNSGKGMIKTERNLGVVPTLKGPLE